MTLDSSPVPPLVDTHCHLDDASFAGDLVDVLGQSREAGVPAWIIVGFAPERWDAAIRMSQEIPGMSHMLGVHPGHAQDWNDTVREHLAAALVESDARAVGEIGFDFYRDNAPYNVQCHALLEQIEMARQLQLPVVFHLREAEEELLDLLERQRDLPRMVFHSFDGGPCLTRFILEHEAVVGVGGLATRQKSVALRDQLLQIPLSQMILETDSPYLVPARQKTRRNMPLHVRTVAQFLSDHLDRPFEDVALETTSTAESLFGSLLP